MAERPRARSCPTILAPPIQAGQRRAGGDHREEIMLLKIIAFLSAAIPIILFVRATFFRRPTKMSEHWREFKKQVDWAIWIFLALVGCVVAFALGKLVWAWWTAT
jgi:hypothetical protein